MRPIKALATTIALTLWAATAPAQETTEPPAGTYRLDPAHARWCSR